MAGRKRKRGRGASKPLVVSTITLQQYERAWDLFRGHHTNAAICAATGLTLAQLQRLKVEGDPAAQRPSFMSRLGALAARAARKRDAAADQLGEMAEAGLVRQARLADEAQELLGQVTGLIRDAIAWAQEHAPNETMLLPDVDDGTEGPQPYRGAGASQGVPALFLLKVPQNIPALVRLLKDLGDYGAIGDAFERVYGTPPSANPAQQLPAGWKPAPGDRSMLPASVPDVSADQGDELDRMTASFSGWTEEDLQRYAADGTLPAHARQVIDATAVEPEDSE